MRKAIILSATLLVAACGQPADTGASETAAADAGAGDPGLSAASGTAAPAAAPAADATPAAPVAFASLAGDAAAGEKLFVQCKTCHSVEAGKNGVGPSLAGVVGRASGAVDGYAYSAAYQGGKVTWTPEELFAYLEKPVAKMPGSKMSFALPDAQKRADVIAYLGTVK